MKIVLPYLRYVVVKYDFLKHFAFTIYSGLPLKLSFFFSSLKIEKWRPLFCAMKSVGLSV